MRNIKHAQTSHISRSISHVWKETVRWGGRVGGIQAQYGLAFYIFFSQLFNIFFLFFFLLSHCCFNFFSHLRALIAPIYKIRLTSTKCPPTAPQKEGVYREKPIHKRGLIGQGKGPGRRKRRKYKVCYSYFLPGRTADANPLTDNKYNMRTF